MDQYLASQLGRLLGVPRVDRLSLIQSLWSGCGQVARVDLPGGRTAVIKHVKMPDRIEHPRGWNTDRSAQRKRRSYDVETHWYAQWSDRCGPGCRVPRYQGHASWGEERLLVMEDIDAAGYSQRPAQATPEVLASCIRWLASFHATFLNEPPKQLWDKGTYWHLGTRPDEHAAMPDGPLKQAAHTIDAALDASPFQTLVHGDAKLANFCFSADGRAAAVDFQYVGGGCGIKDLAYLVGGCLDSDACFEQEDPILTTYFTALKAEIANRKHPIDSQALETNWRQLYPYAWADFQRFLVGWSPSHWKITPYSQAMTEQALHHSRDPHR